MKSPQRFPRPPATYGGTLRRHRRASGRIVRFALSANRSRPCPDASGFVWCSRLGGASTYGKTFPRGSGFGCGNRARVTAAPKYGFSVVAWADDVRGAHSVRQIVVQASMRWPCMEDVRVYTRRTRVAVRKGNSLFFYGP